MLTNEEFFRTFRQAVSNERLDHYIQHGAGGGDENLVTHYAWNMALSESLYTPIQCLEVSLRNAIHTTLTAEYNTDRWFDNLSLLTTPSQIDIAKAKANIARLGKAETPGQVIATLTFGFWTGLFSRGYQNTFWPKISRHVFSGLPNRERVRPSIAAQLNEIRLLRSRIMHHEPIWYLSDLKEKHRKTLKFIHAINPAMLDFNTSIDRFPELYYNHMAAFQAGLQTKLPHIIIP